MSVALSPTSTQAHYLELSPGLVGERPASGRGCGHRGFRLLRENNQGSLLPNPGGPSWVSGKYSAGLQFDGTGDYISTGSGASLDIRGAQTITWDVENRPTSVSQGGSPTATFAYDGDGQRVKKTEGGQTTLYVNKYYEVNITTGVATLHYYLGNKEIAFKTGGVLRLVHQDHLGSTAEITDVAGNQVEFTAYYPFGGTRASGLTSTDKKFTGQRLDGIGLYYYRAEGPSIGTTDAGPNTKSALTVTPLWAGRYYDPSLGRFIQPDTIIPDIRNPQSLNRYSYVLNNPLRYDDPNGHDAAAVAQPAPTTIVIGGSICMVVSAGTCVIVVAGVFALGGVIAYELQTGAISDTVEKIGSTITNFFSKKGSKSDSKKVEAAQSLEKVAQEHIGRIGPECGENKQCGRELLGHAKRAVDNMKKELKRAGPKASQKIQDIIERTEKAIAEAEAKLNLN